MFIILFNRLINTTTEVAQFSEKYYYWTKVKTQQQNKEVHTNVLDRARNCTFKLRQVCSVSQDKFE